MGSLYHHKVEAVPIPHLEDLYIHMVVIIQQPQREDFDAQPQRIG